MTAVEKISIAITSDLASSMRRVVETGEYASVNEVVREALSEWERRSSERERTLDDLIRLADEGLNSGPPIDGAAAYQRLLSRLQAKSDPLD